MARKRKTSALEDLIELVSLLPWWVGVAVAAISYVALHHITALLLVTVAKPGPTPTITSVMSAGVALGLATVGQYVLPLVGLIGAAISLFRHRRRAALVADVAQAHSANALNGMSWREFETLVGEAYRLQGYRVTETGGGGPDGGIDLKLTKDNENFLVQCKQWRAYRVGVDVVRELYGVMAAKGATGGFVVTSGRFTEAAKAFAEGRNIQLVDGPKLFGIIKQAKLSLAATAQ